MKEERKYDKEKSSKEKSKEKERSFDKSKDEDKKKESSKHKKDGKIEAVEPKKEDVRIVTDKVKEVTKKDKDKAKAKELDKSHDKSDRKSKEKKEKSEKSTKEKTEVKSHKAEKEKRSEDKAKEVKNEQKKDDRKSKSEEKKNSEHKEKRKKESETKTSEKLISKKHSTDKKEIKEKVKVEQKSDTVPKVNKESKDKTHDKAQESTKTKHDEKKTPRKDKIASKTMPVSKGTIKPEKKVEKSEKDIETGKVKASEDILERKVKVRKDSSSSVSSVSLSSPSQVFSSDSCHALSPERSKPSMPLEKLINNISTDSSSCESDFGSPGVVRKNLEKEVKVKKEERPLSRNEEEAYRGKVPPKLVMSDTVNRSRSPSADLTVKQETSSVCADNLKKQTNKNKYPSTLYRLAVQNKERENELLQKEKEKAELKAKEAKKLEESAKRVAKPIGPAVVRPATSARPVLTDRPAAADRFKVKVEVQSPTTSSSTSESEENDDKRPIPVPEPRPKPSQMSVKKSSADGHHLSKRLLKAVTVKAGESSSDSEDESSKRLPPPKPSSRGISQKPKSPSENESESAKRLPPLRPGSRGASKRLKTPSDDDNEPTKMSPQRPTSRSIYKKIEHCSESFSSSEEEKGVKVRHVNSLVAAMPPTVARKTSKTLDKNEVKGLSPRRSSSRDISKKLKDSRESFSSSEGERDYKTNRTSSPVTAHHATKTNQIIKTFDTEPKRQMTEKNNQEVTSDKSSSTSEDENDTRTKERDSRPAAQHAMKTKRTIKTDGTEQGKKLMNKKKREILAAKLKKHSSLSESSTSSKESEIFDNKPTAKKSLFTKQNGRSVAMLETKNSGQNSKRSDSLSDSSSDTETDVDRRSKLTPNKILDVKVEKREDAASSTEEGVKQNGMALHSDMKKVSEDKFQLGLTSEINKFPLATLSDDEKVNFQPPPENSPPPLPLLSEDSSDEEIKKPPKFPPCVRKTSLLSKTRRPSSSSDTSDSESDEPASTLFKKSRPQKRPRDTSSERGRLSHPGSKRVPSPRLPPESISRQKSVNEDYLEVKPAGVQWTDPKNEFSDLSRFTKDYLADLLELQNRVCSVSDPDIAQRIVDAIEETGCFEISANTFDFDACKLDLVTIQKLRNILNF